LGTDERVVVQTCLSPLGPVAHATAANVRPAGSLVQRLWTGRLEAEPDGEEIRAARIKQAAPLFAATVRIGVTASDGRARSLLLRTLAAFHVANAPGVHLRRRARSTARVGVALAGRALPLVHWPCTLNAAELAGLLAFPYGEVALQGLRLGGCR